MADRLNELSEFRWVGGGLQQEPSIGLLESLSLGDSWAIELGVRPRDGHWVVVDRVERHAGVWVRDPAVGSYRLPIHEFLGLARYMMVVLEEAAP